MLAMLSSQAGIRPTELASAIYSHRNCDAARHLYRVTAGLESMIIGEAEIQGQVKRAYDAALPTRPSGPLTNHLFKAALATGKRVRTETAISERQLSLPAVAVALAKEQLGSLDGRERRDRRNRRDERADRARARRQRRAHACSSRAAPARPRVSLARRYGGHERQLRRAPVRRSSGPTSSSPRPHRRTCCSRRASWPR